METTKITNFEDLQNLINNNPIHIISGLGLESWKPNHKETQVIEIELNDQEYENHPLNLQYDQYFTLFIYKDHISLIVDLYNHVEQVNFNQGADDDFYDYRPDTLYCILRCLELLKTWKGIDHKRIANHILTRAQEYNADLNHDNGEEEFQSIYGDIINEFRAYLNINH